MDLLLKEDGGNHVAGHPAYPESVHTDFHFSSGAADILLVFVFRLSLGFYFSKRFSCWSWLPRPN